VACMGDTQMKTFLIAAVAVAISGAAYAKDLKGSVRTDSEMDKVTAGSVNRSNIITNPGADSFNKQLNQNFNCHNADCSRG
jgi:hypothetical protein